MKLRAAIVGLVLLGQPGCSTDNDISPSTDDTSIPTAFNDDPSIVTLNGKWKVHFFENLNTHVIEYKTQQNSAGQDIIVEFDDTQAPKSFSGIKTTNVFGGEFEYVSTRKFKLRNVISTLAGQPAWGDEFDKIVSEGIHRGVTFTISSEMLCIYYDNKTKSMVLTKE